MSKAPAIGAVPLALAARPERTISPPVTVGATAQAARTPPIAVVARPEYEGTVRAVCAMGWLRRFVRPPELAKTWTQWSPPAILIPRLPLDPASAIAARATRRDRSRSLFRDAVTRHLIR